jgi:lipoate-protein ligase A
MDYWRLILDGKNSASYNMAADAFLLEQADQGDSPPVVRIYGWDQPSITIGYHQKLERAVDTARLGTTPVVRRITGGRALLHDDSELTYAVAGNFERYPELGLSLSDSYHIISRAIVSFYNTLGLPARISQRDRPVSIARSISCQNGCFASVSRFEITIGDRKIAAGSQRRTKSAYMQHGSIKIESPINHPAISGLSHPVDFEDLGLSSPVENAKTEALINSFESILSVALSRQPFSSAEKAAIHRSSGIFENLNFV